MSEPLRYLAKCPWYSIELQAHPRGEFVLYSDYASLKAEVERLTKAGDMCDQLLACFEMEGRRGVNIGRDMWREAKGVQL